MMRVVVGKASVPIAPSRSFGPLRGGQSLALQSKPTAAISAVEDLKWDTMSAEELATLASTGSLLGDTRTFVLSGALAGVQGDEFLALAEGLVQSPHTFIFEEEKLLKKPLDALVKKGVVVEMLPVQKKEEPFNVFAVGGAFAARDRKKLWLLLMEATRRGVVPEALAGMLHWKVRDMLAKNTLGKYGRAELKAISRELVALYHDSHRGAGPLELLLESFALRL